MFSVLMIPCHARSVNWAQASGLLILLKRVLLGTVLYFLGTVLDFCTLDIKT